METWSLPKARPISCNDCPAFQRLHMSTRWFAESFTRLRSVINTTFREKIYIRWCCIDRLSRQDFSGTGGERSMNAIVLLSRAERYWLQRFVWLDVKTAVLLDI